MSKRILPLSLTALASALLLTGCPHGTSVPTNVVSITPSLGKVLNARVVLRNARNNQKIDEKPVDSSGRAVFQVPASVDLIVAEVVGGAAASYFDEATNSLQNLPASTSLRAAAPVSGNTSLGVTALTEAAVQNANTLAGGLAKPENVTAANQAVASALGVTNILQPPVPIGSASDYQTLGDDAASRYALQLASLVRTAQSAASTLPPALNLLQKLGSDLSDGVLDGKQAGTAVADLPYPTLPSVFAASWQLAMQDVVQTLSSQTVKDALQSSVISKVDVKDTNTGTVVSGDTSFGGGSKQPWKGEIYLLASGTAYLPDFGTLTPIGTLYTGSIDISPRSFTDPFPGVPSNRFEWFGVRYQGPLTIQADGDYNFRTISDDGSKVYMDDQLIINHDGQHAPSSSATARVTLTRGVHTLRVEYFQGPATQIALQVFGNKVGETEHILTPVL